VKKIARPHQSPSGLLKITHAIGHGHAQLEREQAERVSFVGVNLKEQKERREERGERREERGEERRGEGGRTD